MLVQIAARPRDQRLGLLGAPAATHHEDWRVHAKVADAPGFTDGEVERRNPEGGEKLFHRILGGDDGDDRSGCFRCTPVAVENVHVSVSPSQPRELPAAAIAITSLRISWRMAGGSLAERWDGHQRAPPSQRRRSSNRMTSSLLP